MTSTEIEVDDPQLSSYPMYRLPRGKKWHYVSRSMSKLPGGHYHYGPMLKGAGGVVEFLCGSMATAEGIEDAEKRQDFLLDDAEKCRACVYHLPRAGAARLAGGD